MKNCDTVITKVLIWH